MVLRKYLIFATANVLVCVYGCFAENNITRACLKFKSSFAIAMKKYINIFAAHCIAKV